MFRELNSPQAAELGRTLRRRAEGIVWPLVEKQLAEIEGELSLSPAQKLIYRGKLIGTLASLMPKQIEQTLSGGLEWKVTVVDELADTGDEVETPPGAEDSPPE